jgi:hypothetical protein
MPLTKGESSILANEIADALSPLLLNIADEIHRVAEALEQKQEPRNVFSRCRIEAVLIGGGR